MARMIQLTEVLWTAAVAAEEMQANRRGRCCAAAAWLLQLCIRLLIAADVAASVAVGLAWCCAAALPLLLCCPALLLPAPGFCSRSRFRCPLGTAAPAASCQSCSLLAPGRGIPEAALPSAAAAVKIGLDAQLAGLRAVACAAAGGLRPRLLAVLRRRLGWLAA